ncbi:MAG: hypothetical protein GF334_11340 [Candidatus Altiarchaeales archaeon]|nr:hypothetical protein [Candidatus Altiarchaeales archaeon]
MNPRLCFISAGICLGAATIYTIKYGISLIPAIVALIGIINLLLGLTKPRKNIKPPQTGGKPQHPDFRCSHCGYMWNKEKHPAPEKCPNCNCRHWIW